MTRQVRSRAASPRTRITGLLSLCLLGGLGALVLILAGCGQTSQLRGKSAEESEAARYDIPTVGDRTAVGNAEPMSLGGVGLVEGLEGTGGDCAHDSYRAMLAKELTSQHAQHLLGSPDCALVIVEATLPPGSSKGDKIDVEVKLPPGSKATSLRGGVLRKCFLYNYDFARNLRPDYNGSNNLMIGHKRAVAAGPILVTSGEGEEAALLKQGRIWQGALSLGEHPLALVMTPDSQQARFTSLISDRINSTFQGTGIRAATDARIAHTSDNLKVALRVPVQYRNNLPRYIRVVRSIPLGEVTDAVPKEGDDKRSYRQKLTDDLVEPSRTIVAALRLEALGQRSIPALKTGLKSQHPLVRFASAEALAYLGSPSGCEELGETVARYPVLRAYALSALASLDEAASTNQLKRLVMADHDDDEARCGAFRALHMLNPRDPLVRGERLNDSFELHAIAKHARPLIHVSTAKRAEIVLFGKAPALKPPFSILAGEFAVTATEGSSTTAVSRVPLRGKPTRKICGLEVEDVIRTMSELGAAYPEVLAMLMQASSCDAVSCRLRVDALPQPTSVHELARLGKDPTGQELLPGGAPAPVQQTGSQGGGR